MCAPLPSSSARNLRLVNGMVAVGFRGKAANLPCLRDCSRGRTVQTMNAVETWGLTALMLSLAYISSQSGSAGATMEPASTRELTRSECAAASRIAMPPPAASDHMRRVDRKGVEELGKIPDCGAWVPRGSSLRPVKTATGIADDPIARSGKYRLLVRQIAQPCDKG